jgi:hypothetical protein
MSGSSTLRSLALAGAMMATTTGAQQPAATPRHEILVGVQLGTLLPYGLEVSYLQRTIDSLPLFAADLRLEPSHYWRSYSVGASYHIQRKGLFLGARLRRLWLHNPSSRGYDPYFDDQIGVSPEIGWRWFPARFSRVMLTASGGATFVPTPRLDLPVVYNLNVGVAWRLRRW